ncbi:MAG: tetratricopeptide repeat protein, partial [Blastocatellia bacterium]
MRRPSTIHAIALAAFACLSILLTVTAQEAQEARPLEPGKPVEREMAGGQTHAYQLTLAADQYLHLVVEQRGIDVVAVILGPDGKKLAEVDSPNGTQGPEPFTLITETPGSYRIEVRSPEKTAPAGRYEVKVQELRIATARDKSRVIAERVFLAAEQLRARDQRESLRRAIEKYEEALPLWRAAEDVGRQADTLLNLGQCHISLNEHQKATDRLEQALALRRTMNDRRGEAETLHNLGSAYYFVEDKSRALEYYNQALSLWRAVKYPAGEAATLNNIGLIYDDQGERRKALEYFEQALPLWRAAQDRQGEGVTLNQMSRIYSFLGEKQKALDHYHQFLALTRATGNRRSEASTLHNLAGVYDNLGEKEKARDYLNKALALNQTVGDREGEATTRHGIARVERGRDNLREAQTQIATALNLAESVRTKIASQELRASYFATVQDYYSLNVDLLMQLHKQEPAKGHNALALETGERARARSLLDILTEARADIRGDIDPSLLTRERGLQQQLSAREQARMQLLASKHTPEQAAAADKELRDLSTQYQELKAQIRTTSPRYAALTQPQPLTLAEIQQQVLDADTLLVEYALGEERSYLWAVSHDAITSFELPKRAEIEAAARSFHDGLVAFNQPSRTAGSKDATGAPARTGMAGTGAALSRMLLAPIAARLGTKRLLIVTDGALQYVPFAALSKSATGYQPLIVEHEVISLPSASSLAVLRRELAGRKTAAKALALFADPVFSADDSRLQRAQAATQSAAPPPAANETREMEPPLTRAIREAGVADAGLRIPRLPGTRREAAAIIALVPTAERKQALDFEASRATATSEELSQYRIVHFATHGLLNSTHPELSGIVLSLVDAQGKPQDGFLRMHEI